MTSNWTNQSFLGKSCSLGAEDHSLNTSTVVVISLLSSLLLLISVLGNALLCYLLTRFRHPRTVPNNLLVVDLVVVNLLHTAVNGPLFLCSGVLGVDIIRGRLWGFIMFALHVFFSFITLTTMFMMLLDRFLAIRYPFEHKSTKKTNLVAICVKWFLSLVPILIICGPLYAIDLGGCLAFYYRAAYTKEPIFQIGRYFTGPPLLLASICLYIMSRHRLSLSVPELSNQQRTTKLKSRKALTTILLTVTCFCFCYASSFVIIAVAFRPFDNLRLQLFVVYFLLFIPGAVNPFIYFIRVQRFEVVMKEQWHRICRSRMTRNLEGARTYSVKNAELTSVVRKLDFNGQNVVQLRVLSSKEQSRTSLEDIYIQESRSPRDGRRQRSLTE